MNPCFEDFMFSREHGNNNFEKFDVYRLPNNDVPVGSFKLFYKVFYKTCDVGNFYLFDENEDLIDDIDCTKYNFETIEDCFKEFCIRYKDRIAK